MRSLVIALAFLSVARLLSAQGRSSDEAAIREHTAAYESAVNKGDAAAIAALFASDGDFIFFDGPRLTGRVAIQRDTEARFSTRPATMRFTLAVTGIRFVGPEAAIVDTHATFSEGPMQANRGTSVMVRRDGQWLLAALRVFPAQGSP